MTHPMDTEMMDLETSEDVIENLGELAHKVSQAQLHGIEHLAVSNSVFEYFAKGQKTPFISYGSPTVALHKKGEWEKIQKDMKKVLSME